MIFVAVIAGPRRNAVDAGIIGVERISDRLGQREQATATDEMFGHS
jgi:hypothetical protein